MMMINVTRSSVVVRELRVAHNMIERLRGLMASKPLRNGEGLLIPHCQGIHTFGMGYHIDAIYLDKENKTIFLYEGIAPHKFGKICFKAQAVLELPVGSIALSGTQLGDALLFG